METCHSPYFVRLDGFQPTGRTERTVECLRSRQKLETPAQSLKGVNISVDDWLADPSNELMGRPSVVPTFHWVAQSTEDDSCVAGFLRLGGNPSVRSPEHESNGWSFTKKPHPRGLMLLTFGVGRCRGPRRKSPVGLRPAWKTSYQVSLLFSFLNFHSKLSINIILKLLLFCSDLIIVSVTVATVASSESLDFFICFSMSCHLTTLEITT